MTKPAACSIINALITQQNTIEILSNLNVIDGIIESRVRVIAWANRGQTKTLTAYSNIIRQDFGFGISQGQHDDSLVRERRGRRGGFDNPSHQTEYLHLSRLLTRICVYYWNLNWYDRR